METEMRCIQNPPNVHLNDGSFFTVPSCVHPPRLHILDQWYSINNLHKSWVDDKGFLNSNFIPGIWRQFQPWGYLCNNYLFTSFFVSFSRWMWRSWTTVSENNSATGSHFGRTTPKLLLSLSPLFSYVVWIVLTTSMPCITGKLSY